MDFRQLKMQVMRRLARDLQTASLHFAREFTMPSVQFNVRGAKAGVAYFQRNEIRFNPVLLQENQQQFIDTVVPHELAHILVYQQFGEVSAHGKEWKMMMERVLGVKADLYHCFDVSNTRKTFLYRCDCQTHALSTQRHNAIQRKQRVYHCTRCKTPLRFAPNAAESAS